MIIDKRAYQPLCTLCFDQGCEACQPYNATVLNQISAQSQANEFLVKVYADCQHKSPRNREELVTLIAAAIEYGRFLQSNPLGLCGSESLPPDNRFALLEMR